mmetsp:Transcript_18574/g.47598  ORF Transcript_18574/g.47598 Transcript_18574/m.47598 type:complete len:192 (+) Transcript_18574:16-591(+)
MGAPNAAGDEALSVWGTELWVEAWRGRSVTQILPGSAPAMVRECLRPDISVDFPKLTEICERAAAHPQEVEPAVLVLIGALGDCDAKTKLKVLTICNEMVFEQEIATQFRRPAAREVFEPLREFRGSELGVQGDETVRMLATEVCKTVFAQPEQQQTMQRQGGDKPVRQFAALRALNALQGLGERTFRNSG